MIQFTNLSGGNGRSIQPWRLILFLVLGVVLLVMLARFVFWVASLLLPVLVIATLFINHRVFINYGKLILRNLQNNTAMGVLMLLGTVFGFPIVVLFLFIQAIMGKRLEKMQQIFDQQQFGMGNTTSQNTKDETITFEEVENDQPTAQQHPPLILDLPNKESRTTNNPYDDFFKRLEEQSKPK
jgi:hypothetical protein